jgi:hypothetical protein
MSYNLELKMPTYGFIMCWRRSYVPSPEYSPLLLKKKCGNCENFKRIRIRKRFNECRMGEKAKRMHE